MATDKLIIKKDSKKQLSDKQLAFNKLTEKIEKLKQQLDKKKAQLEDAVILYGREVAPFKPRFAAQYRSVLEILYPLYKNNSLKVSKNDFKELLRFYLEELFAATPGEPDELMKEIFQALEGVDFEKVKEDEAAEMREEMQRMFDGLNMKVNATDGSLTDEELFAKMFEAQQKLRDMEAEQQEKLQEQQSRRKAKKAKTKSAQQLEKERIKAEAELLKQKNISSIYKQLVKLFHPDLEQDEDRRAEKELLMKELTVAYEAKNMHALLMLELKWIHKETDHLEKLTDEKLDIYNELLKEQARQLEAEKYAVVQQPKYGILFEEYGYDVAQNPLKCVNDGIKAASRELAARDILITKLQTPGNQKYIKSLIKEHKEMNAFWNDDDDDDDAFLDAMIADFFK